MNVSDCGGCPSFVAKFDVIYQAIQKESSKHLINQLSLEFLNTLTDMEISEVVETSYLP